MIKRNLFLKPSEAGGGDVLNLKPKNSPATHLANLFRRSHGSEDTAEHRQKLGGRAQGPMGHPHPPSSSPLSHSQSAPNFRAPVWYALQSYTMFSNLGHSR